MVAVTLDKLFHNKTPCIKSFYYDMIHFWLLNYKKTSFSIFYLFRKSHFFQGISEESDLNHRIHTLKELCEVVEKKEIEEVPTLYIFLVWFEK